MNSCPRATSHNVLFADLPGMQQSAIYTSWLAGILWVCATPWTLHSC